MLIGPLLPQGSIPASTQVLHLAHLCWQTGGEQSTPYICENVSDEKTKNTVFSHRPGSNVGFIQLYSPWFCRQALHSWFSLKVAAFFLRSSRLALHNMVWEDIWTFSWVSVIFSDSHKYRKKHFKEEKIIFLLFIKEVDFQDRCSCREHKQESSQDKWCVIMQCIIFRAHYFHFYIFRFLFFVTLRYSGA